MNVTDIISRDQTLFLKDLASNEKQITSIVKQSRFLVIGGAGSIGQAVTKELFKRDPICLHVLDNSENNLVELVRDIRSSQGYISGDFQTFALDIGGIEFDYFMAEQQPYDYVLNLAALKHVRSENDPYTLMRMLDVNVLNAIKVSKMVSEMGAKKYFCVSTDKATNPANLMGASKRIMELALMQSGAQTPISFCRFANVAFSNGSLLHGFKNRIEKRQPITAPKDVSRFFMTHEEAGILCLFSCLLGRANEIFVPKQSKTFELVSMVEVAIRFLSLRGYKAFECGSEREAREMAAKGRKNNDYWPCFFFKSDTDGEKLYEEFYSDADQVDTSKFGDIEVVKGTNTATNPQVSDLVETLMRMRGQLRWNKDEILALFKASLPDFDHIQTGKTLNDRM